MFYSSFIPLSSEENAAPQNAWGGTRGLKGRTDHPPLRLADVVQRTVLMEFGAETSKQTTTKHPTMSRIAPPRKKKRMMGLKC